MEDIYNKIAIIINNNIPGEWSKLYLYAEVREGYRKVFFYYYPSADTEPVYSLDITDKFNLNEDEFDELENQLYTCFSGLREEFKKQEQEPWSNLTFILDNIGSMKVDYDYEDVSDISPVDKQNNWEEEYLEKE